VYGDGTFFDQWNTSFLPGWRSGTIVLGGTAYIHHSHRARLVRGIIAITMSGLTPWPTAAPDFLAEACAGDSFRALIQKSQAILWEAGGTVAFARSSGLSFRINDDKKREFEVHGQQTLPRTGRPRQCSASRG